MKNLRVAIVMPTHFDIHSSLENLLKVYRYLIKNKNIEVTIFTDNKNNVKFEDFKIEKINSIDYNSILSKFLFIFGIPRFYYTDLISKLKGFDIIESSNPEFYLFAYQSFNAAKKYDTILIYRTSQTVDGFFLFKFTKYLIIPIMKRAYDYAKFLLFTNPMAEERCLRLGLIKNDKKDLIIGHPTDTKTFKPLNLIKDKRKKILLSVGGLYKIKGHHLIIKSLKKLIERGHDIELWIVGEGYYKNQLKKLVDSMGLKDSVKFLGIKNHDELAKIYNLSDIFILANYQEITPAVNEALVCEIPIVAMECGGCNFVIPNKDYGLISKRFDIDDMSNKIEYLINNKKLAEKMAKRGRQHIMENFSIEKVADKIYNGFIK